MNKPIRIATLITASIAVLGVCWFSYYYFFTFHIIKTTPSTRDIATLTPSISIQLNREIKDIHTITISPNPDYIDSYSFSGKEISISLNELFAEKIEITLIDVQSVEGDIITKSLTFTPSEKNFSELPEYQQDEILVRQDKNTDKNADPIQLVIPHSTLNYSLSLSIVGQKPNGGNRYEIEARIILSQTDINIDEQKAIDTYKNDIDTYLTSNNIDPDSYTINYTIEKL